MRSPQPSPSPSPLPSLVLERLPDRLRLYLGGDLQFDTHDEAIYHERLALPALDAVETRFDGPLDAVILGGGDGLLAREILRRERIRSVTIIDLNPEVLALARSELTPYNQGAWTTRGFRLCLRTPARPWTTSAGRTRSSRT